MRELEMCSQCLIPEEVGQGHGTKHQNCGISQRKLTDQSTVMHRSCSQPDPQTNHMQQGRAGNEGLGMQLVI